MAILVLMDPHLLAIPLSSQESFSVKLEIGWNFYKQWHYHREIEIIYIIKGTGTRFIGDRIDNFREDELLLIGSNVPHMLRTHGDLTKENPDTEAIVVHFLPDILGSFINLPENKAIADLLFQSAHGLDIKGETLLSAKRILHSIRYARNTEKLILLIQFLHLIATSTDTEALSQLRFTNSFNKLDDDRLNRIYNYTMNNFLRQITLKEIADVVHMSPNSFCRYFKSRTKKRYSAFLLEIRVSHACKLLAETGYSMAVIAYESGFMNVSNFNRHFKLIIGKTPFQYRAQLLSLKGGAH